MIAHCPVAIPILRRFSVALNRSPGRPAANNRRFINAVFRVLRAGAPGRDLLPAYGDWSNTHRRFIRWRNKNVRRHTWRFARYGLWRCGLK